ncbi:M20/M25/M40 family metallo-hydrolase [Streptomyces sp. NPDC058861]|uniref:M20/M25/M40 family metallo-hydrolase n=1 Tax=Streptomyces sp. NPDC058861 TaxID=3346653 RepID=UPI0036CA6FC0
MSRSAEPAERPERAESAGPVARPERAESAGPVARAGSAGRAALLDLTGRITGIGDEAAPGLAGQIAVARELGWTSLELRSLDGTALADLPEPDVREAAGRLHAAGLGVVCLDSRIGNWARPVIGPFSADLEELERLAAYGRILGCRSLRVMSWTDGGLSEDAWAAGAIDRMRRLARRAEALGVELLHENCAGWAGSDASRTLRLLTEVDSPALRVLFDTGNGVPYGYDAHALLEELLPHVAHVHIKDALPGDRPGEAVYTLPGEGAARVADCVRLLEEYGYRGAYSLEPHLAVVPHEGVRDEDAAGPFVRAARRLAALPLPAPRAAPNLLPRPAVDTGLLLHLLHTPTAGPLETGPGAPHLTAAAHRSYATAAERLGFTTVRLGAPDPSAVLRDDTPAPVRRAVAADPAFLADQPSLVLRLGPELPRERTVMFNVHLDTVAGGEPPAFDGARFTGRGAVDAKGPAVALLAGVAAAARTCPAVGRDVAVLVQAVAGEEGGALGTFGTRPLVEAGHTGRLNVFCEPTGLRHLPRATAAATARIAVDGEDAVDDRPEAGHNATVLLGFLARHLAAALGREASGEPPFTVCVAGLHTGTLHNKVYGTGSLLLNLAYATAGAGAAAERALARALDEGLREFTARFSGTPPFARTAADAARITRLEWEKRGLPALGPQPAWGEELLARAGVDRWPDEEPGFTCDAIWAEGLPDAFTTVFGPGSLDANRAHAAGEFVDLADLEAFADRTAALLTAFADDVPRGDGTRRTAPAPVPVPAPVPAPTPLSAEPAEKAGTA